MALAPLFPILHPILKSAFPNCLWQGNTQKSEITLTFDDGPHPEYTLQLLEVLDKYQIKANFFWLGICIDRYPEIAKAVYEKGHWIGLHGYEHISFPQLTPIQLKSSLKKTQLSIYNACGLEAKLVCDVRPPNGVFLPQTLKLLQEWGYRNVMWSVVPEDWVRPGISVVVNRVVQQTSNGSIIVLHDGCYGGQDVAKIAAEIIPILLEKNYEFITIDKMWQTNITLRAM
ncbi:polysaccharide deacetylase family protein [Okeania hirsuta]|uniref:Polysaccharide deacetylase family protein n=1 Tax=Okeania hirsuta TaxID=1458930 RepID=A0A3N6Q7P9_9CYAN|nr:polysaccharide deacetylase family protein [Okeania hirsuta]RQH27368.1 polysaccharide deacetylase family protein [Okeania hirsuta]